MSKNSSLYHRVRQYEEDNVTAARIIVADPRYQGALREWAVMILTRAEAARSRKRPAQQVPVKRTTAA
jgi:hypothetical protein